MEFKNDNKTLVDKIVDKMQCKRSSARTYASTIRRIGTTFSGEYKKSLKFLEEKGLLAKIKKHDSSLHTKRNLVNGVIIGLKLLDEEALSRPFHKYLLELNKAVDERSKSGELTEKQLAKTISWEKVVKLRKLLAKQLRLSQAMKRKEVGPRDMKVVNEHLAVCVMSMTPPTRLDWATVSFHNKKGFANIKEKNQNYLVFRRGAVVIYWNNFKTVGKIGSVSHELPKPLATILRRHAKFMREHFPDNDRLFLNSRLEPMSRQTFGKLLENLFFRYFKKKISVSALRRIYLSSKYSHSKILEAQEDAKKMLHSVKTAQSHYIKETK